MKKLYSDKEIETVRKSTDGNQAIIHEETLLERRRMLGFAKLPVGSDESIEWTYPVYDYGSEELNTLLESKNWNNNLNNKA